MKILMLLDHEFPPDIRVENEIQSLHENGHQVHIACYTQQGRKTFEETENCSIHRRTISTFIHKSSVGALRFPIYFNFWRKYLKDIFQEEQFNAIHVHDLPLAQIGYEFSKKYNTKFTLDLHENWPALLRVATHTQSMLGKFLSVNKQWENYEMKYCQLADNIIVVVNEAKQRLTELRIDEHKITVVSNTLNLAHFEVPETKPDPDYITLLYAGGINKHRGLQTVIKGLKHLHNLPKPVRLWILGTGSYVDELKALVTTEGVKEKVFFEGWKNYQEMQAYFGKSDYCLIPHVKNDHTDSTIPHKIFQYMYAGKPMLVSDCAPLKRIVEETNSGLVYEFDQPRDFADKLVKLVNNNDFHAKDFVQSNRNQVVDLYNWHIDSSKLNALYQ